jgi:tellurite resistance protein TehA-like permease
MTIPTSDIANAIIEHPKASAGLALGITAAERFWIEWGSWVVDALYSVAGLVLVCLLIHKHIVSINNKKE